MMVECVMAECPSLLYVGRLYPSNSITTFCSEFVVQFVPTLLHSSWQDFDGHITLHGLSAVAELFVM